MSPATPASGVPVGSSVGLRRGPIHVLNVLANRLPPVDVCGLEDVHCFRVGGGCPPGGLLHPVVGGPYRQPGPAPALSALSQTGGVARADGGRRGGHPPGRSCFRTARNPPARGRHRIDRRSGLVWTESVLRARAFGHGPRDRTLRAPRLPRAAVRVGARVGVERGPREPLDPGPAGLPAGGPLSGAASVEGQWHGERPRETPAASGGRRDQSTAGAAPTIRTRGPSLTVRRPAFMPAAGPKTHS